MRNKQKKKKTCAYKGLELCVREMCVCACVCDSALPAVCCVCLRGIRGDPCGTGIYNRPAGLSLCDDKALGVLCERLCVRICVTLCIPAGCSL